MSLESRNAPRAPEASPQTSEMERFFESMSLALIQVDTQRRIRRVNPAFTCMFGYSRDAMLGREGAANPKPDGEARSGEECLEKLRSHTGRLDLPERVEEELDGVEAG